MLTFLKRLGLATIYSLLGQRVRRDGGPPRPQVADGLCPEADLPVTLCAHDTGRQRVQPGCGPGPGTQDLQWYGSL
jgi:hypothetical protein